MIRPIAILAFMGVIVSTALAQSPVPAHVMVGTEEMKAKDFAVWAENDPAKYDGAFAGDVGGDSTGELTFKAGKAEKEESPALASGSYILTPAGSVSTVVKFENAVCSGDETGVFSAGAFNLVFVKYGKTSGVIVGNAFIPKTKA